MGNFKNSHSFSPVRGQKSVPCLFHSDHNSVSNCDSTLVVVFQGEPLPAALVELVRNTPISSIEDLQLLLLTDSVGKDLQVLIL